MVPLAGYSTNNEYTQEVTDTYFKEGVSFNYMSGFRLWENRDLGHTYREGATGNTIYTFWGLDDPSSHNSASMNKENNLKTPKCPISKFTDAIWPDPFLTYAESGVTVSLN